MSDTHIHLTEEFKENLNGVLKVIKGNTESTSLHSVIGDCLTDWPCLNKNEMKWNEMRGKKKNIPISAQPIKLKREPTEFPELFAQNR